MVVVMLRLRLAMFAASASQAPWSIVPLSLFTVAGIIAGISTIQEMTVLGAGAVPPVVVRGSSALVIAVLIPPLLPRPGYRLGAGDLRRFGLGLRDVVVGTLIAGISHPLVVVMGVSALVLAAAGPPQQILFRCLGALCGWVLAGTTLSVSCVIAEQWRLLLKVLLFTVGFAALIVTAIAAGALHTAPTITDGALNLLALSPFGAAWAAVGSATPGAALAAAILWCTVTAAVLMFVTGRVMKGDLLASRRRTRHPRLSLRSPSTPLGAIVARQVVYGVRDRRRHSEAVGAAFLVLCAAWVAVVTAGWDAALDVAVISATLLIAISPHNSLGLDRTTLWPDMVAGVSGVVDRIGRALPAAVAGAGVTLAGALAVLAHTHDLSTAVMVGLACLCILAAGLGSASVASMILAYPPRRDETSQPPGGQALREAAAIIAALTVAIGCALPALTLTTRPRPDLALAGMDFAGCLMVLACGVFVSARIRSTHMTVWFEQAAEGRYTILTKGRHARG